MKISWLVIPAFVLGLSMPAFAQSFDNTLPVATTEGEPKGKKGKHRQAIKEKLQNMSEEERQAFREEVKQKWEALSDSEKAAFKQKVEERQQKREERKLMRQYGAHLLMQQENGGE